MFIERIARSGPVSIMGRDIAVGEVLDVDSIELAVDLFVSGDFLETDLESVFFGELDHGHQ